MTALRMSIGCTLVLTLLAPGRDAAAHEFWIAPSRYSAMRGVGVELGAVAGTGFRGERKPWSPGHAVRFVLRTAREIELARAASPGDMTWTRFAPGDDGGAMVAFESDWLAIELPASAFDDYLKAEGLDAALAARKGSAAPGRERYRRCAKAWLAGAESPRATEPAGLPLELVPETAPGLGPSLRLRVLRNGRPLAGTLVKAWRTPLATGDVPRPVVERDSVRTAWQGRSDATGAVTIPIHETGEWLVSTVHMERAATGSRDRVDWESTWASLTFSRVTHARSVSDRDASSPAARGTALRP